MLYMVVDAIEAGGSIAGTYPVTLDDAPGQSVTEDDFIQLAKQHHHEEGLDPLSVTEWRVREPDDDARII